MQIALDDEGTFMLVADELDRVMPSRRAVMSAGRYDLHHAIQYHGGYTQVPLLTMAFVAGCLNPLLATPQLLPKS